MTSFCLASIANGAKGVFTPAIGVGAQYSDNIYLTHDNRESDIVLYASPSFTWDFSGERNTLTLFFSPTFRDYVKGSEANVTHYNASLTSAIPVTQDTVFELSDTYLLSDDPTEELEGATMRRTREVYQRNTTQMGLTSTFGPFDSAYVRCAYAVLRNDDSSLQDSDQFTPSAGITFRFLSAWLLSVDGSYTLGEFLNRQDQEQFTEGGADDFDTLKTTIRLSRQINHFMDIYAQYSQSYMRYKGMSEDYDVSEPALGFSVAMDDAPLFSLQVGYYTMDRETSKDESGMTITGNLGRSFRFKKGSIHCKGSSGYEDSYLSAENLGFSIYHQAEAGLTYGVTPYLQYDFSIQARNDRYMNLGYKRIDTIYQAQTGISYLVMAWCTVRFAYEYLNVDVNTAHIKNQEHNDDYEENRLILEAFFSPASHGEEQ